MDDKILSYFKQIQLPESGSHKGQNGKLLIIGGSELFHAASKWSLDIASKFVDMVFYASVPSNNELVQHAKQELWNGIVVPREELENYLVEADCILIGPGMSRRPFTDEEQGGAYDSPSELTSQNWNEDTKKIADYLLKKYPDKKWVIDAGALQMVNPKLLTEACIISPHTKEMSDLEKRIPQEVLIQRGVTIVLKGEIDRIIQGTEEIAVEGGNPGMTKGGTGDVLAGLIAALYCTQDKLVAAVAGSYANKAAGDALYEKVGPYFNATDLVNKVPEVFWQLIEKSRLGSR